MSLKKTLCSTHLPEKWKEYFVLICRKNDFTFFVENDKWKKKYFNEWWFQEYTKMQFTEFDWNHYHFLIKETWEMFCSEDWRYFMNENEAIEYVRKINKSIIKEFKKFAIDKGILL